MVDGEAPFSEPEIRSTSYPAEQLLDAAPLARPEQLTAPFEVVPRTPPELVDGPEVVEGEAPFSEPEIATTSYPAEGWTPVDPAAGAGDGLRSLGAGGQPRPHR